MTAASREKFQQFAARVFISLPCAFPVRIKGREKSLERFRRECPNCFA
jgi:hypothetical protein